MCAGALVLLRLRVRAAEAAVELAVVSICRHLVFIFDALVLFPVVITTSPVLFLILVLVLVLVCIVCRVAVPQPHWDKEGGQLRRVRGALKALCARPSPSPLPARQLLARAQLRLTCALCCGLRPRKRLHLRLRMRLRTRWGNGGSQR